MIFFLNDIAAYASTKRYSGSAEDFDVGEFVGSADSVYITLSETTINGVKDKKAFKAYTKEITDKKRLDRLNGKTVKISVGAPTQAERQELKLRIEDAVCAAQTAQDHGVLPGGGVFLRDLQVDAGDDLDRIPEDSIRSLPANEVILVRKVLENGEGIDIYNSKVVDDMIATGIVR